MAYRRAARRLRQMVVFAIMRAMRTLLRRFTVIAAALALTAVARAKTGWTDDYTKALSEAKAGNKLVLLDFTGSDWCSWCIKMEKDVFDKPTFKDYAKDNLVLVEIDFPNNKNLPEK